MGGGRDDADDMSDLGSEEVEHVVVEMVDVGSDRQLLDISAPAVPSSPSSSRILNAAAAASTGNAAAAGSGDPQIGSPAGTNTTIAVRPVTESWDEVTIEMGAADEKVGELRSV